jgi:DNA-binding CsgD family transcriptional regulator
MSAALLLERDAALARVDTLLEGAATGDGGTLFVVGEAGVGKTAVLAAARERAAGRFQILSGQAESLDAGLPYQLVRDALGPGDAGIDTGGAGARAALFYATVRRVEGLAAAGPLLLLLDDLHWADPDSLALVALLCRRLADVPVALIASLRPWPPAAEDAARSLAAAGAAALERLTPLGHDSALDLLRARVGSGDESLLERAWEVAAGNPLLLEQAAAVIGREGDLPEQRSGQELLVSRFAGVSEDGLALARAASILGVAFRPGIATELAAMDEARGDAALAALVRAGLVRAGEPGHARFVHPLFRQAMYDDVEPPVRARLHARAFRILRTLGVDSAECAGQALLADLAGDADAVAALHRAGRQALRSGAAATAAQHLAAALRLAGEAATLDLCLDLAQAELLAGDAEAAVTRCDGLLASEGLEHRRLVDIRRLRGRAAFYVGRLQEADADYEMAVHGSRDDDVDTAVEVAVEHATVFLFAAGPRRAHPLTVAALDLATGASAEVRAAASTIGGLTSTLLGDPGGLAPATDGARELIRFSHSDRAASLAFFATAAACREQADDADSAFATAVEWAESAGDPGVLSLTASSWAAALFHRGRLGEAAELVQRALAMGDLAPGARATAEATAAMVMFERGDRQQADAFAGRATAAGERGEWLPQLWLRFGRLRQHLDDGRLGEATAEARQLLAASGALGVAEPCFVPWARDAVAAHVAAGDTDSAGAVMEWLEAARPLGCAWPAAVLQYADGLLAEREDDLDAVDVGMAGAADLLVGPNPLERARVLLDWGALLRRHGQALRSRPLLGEALEIAERAGAGRLAGLCAAELAIAGGRRRRRSGGNELTAAEGRVARLAVEGLTNAEIAAQLFVSAKTVDTHLQHIYGKLGINSRRELMRRGVDAADG